MVDEEGGPFSYRLRTRGLYAGREEGTSRGGKQGRVRSGPPSTDAILLQKNTNRSKGEGEKRSDEGVQTSSPEMTRLRRQSTALVGKKGGKGFSCVGGREIFLKRRFSQKGFKLTQDLFASREETDLISRRKKQKRGPRGGKPHYLRGTSRYSLCHIGGRGEGCKAIKKKKTRRAKVTSRKTLLSTSSEEKEKV